jgi:major type 1 subunit fimbrin (pilin)
MEIEMKNKFKLMMSATGMISALALPGLIQASDGTITFNGTVTDSTCTVQVNNAGAGDGIVTLPTVSKSLLQNAGDTAGATNLL